MFWTAAATVLAAGNIAGMAGVAHAQDALEKNFHNPPRSARPHTWWHWMNGNVSKEGITADLEAMAKVGIGGAQIFNVDQGIPLGKTPFMSPGWREAMVHAAREAKRLGLELCLHNCAGWSSSGGPWIDPAHSMQMLTWSETPVTGGKPVALTLPEPPKRAGYYNDICVVAFKRPAAGDTFRIPNIRSKAAFDRGPSGLPLGDRWTPGEGQTPAGVAINASDIVVLRCDPSGALKWDAPPGDWIVLRVGHTSTGAMNAPAPAAGRGLEVDKLSREAMNLHWEKGIAPILKDLGPELVGTSLNNALIDSYEVGSQNWTPKFRDEFRRRCGYDLLPWLPVVTGRVVGDAEQSERFLWDLRRTIADLFAENYVGYFRELCHRNGLLFSIEPYGNGPFDNLQIGAMADIPMGEFWVGGGAAETIKIAASSAHVRGKSIVGAESFTADATRGRWLVEPYGVKTLGDRMFAQGLNRVIFHRYAHQPWMGLDPGMTMGPWGTHFERTVTWWDQSATWLQYLARCQFLLQSGRFVADVLTFSGDDAPADLLRPALPPGFDYDGCDRTTLASARVVNGRIVLPGGASYRALILPDSPWMTEATAAKILDLIEHGATVIGAQAPQKSPSLRPARVSVRALGARMKLTPPAALATVLGTPDVAFAAETALPWIHRRAGDADLYFVSNPRLANQSVSATFRVAGKMPELWYPETGRVESAVSWETAGPSTTRVALNLGPAESVFVVFRKGVPANHLVRVARTSGPRLADTLPTMEIISARYEAVDGAGGADVTEKVRQMVARGETEIPATNAIFGDPINLHVKRLRIVFTLDGKPVERTVGENETLSLIGSGADAALPEFEIVGGKLRAYAPGTYAVTDARGKTTEMTAPASDDRPITGPWALRFPPNRGAPPSVSLPELMSWTENADPGVQYFSGSATYTTTFTAPPAATDRALILDLGRVKNFAEIQVNGRPLPTLWKAPWRVDISDLVRPGSANTLSVRVTNLWVNRLIGDEQLPDEVSWTGPTGPIASWPAWLVKGQPRPKTDRIAFTTWRFWTKTDPLLESGLLGPVVLRAVPILPLPK